MPPLLDLSLGDTVTAIRRAVLDGEGVDSRAGDLAVTGGRRKLQGLDDTQGIGVGEDVAVGEGSGAGE